jgi:N-acetylneuraminate synthase
MKPYVIAEIGINHNGSFANCLRMIDAASEAGCDAAKFQLFRASSLYPKSAGKLDWKNNKGGYSYDIYNAIKGFELPPEWLDPIIKYCRKKEIDFLASVFDVSGADLLVKKSVKKIKLSSSSATNLPLVEYCAKKRLPIILSTGGSLLGEVEDAVYAILKHHHHLSLLHCNLSYPTKPEDCNLGVIDTLKFTFPGINIGFSDHTAEVSDAAVQAVYLGARIIEKHITLDKKMAGPDHFFAIEPSELRQMVKDIRRASSAVAKNRGIRIDRVLYGNSAKVVTPNEKYLRDFVFTKLFAKRGIKKGARIRCSNISILRPGKKAHGLDPKYIKLFRDFAITARRDIGPEEPITWGSILK